MNTVRSAELFDECDLEPIADPSGDLPSDASMALKQQVAERLAAHRSRRSRDSATNLVAIPGPQPDSRPKPRLTRAANARSSRVAAAVAERYAHSPSYREFLAAEAARAIEEANATAEIAARNAEAVTAVQQQLLAELDLWDDPAPGPSHPAAAHFLPVASAETRSAEPLPAGPHASPSYRDEWATISAPLPDSETNQPTGSIASGLTVRLYEDVGLRTPALRITSAPASVDEAHMLNELNDLEDEIAFRHAPVSLEPVEPPTPIAANLIEFPRQLVAPRKARPRHAEGPLREEADAAPAAAQLRIFEVDPSHFSTAAIAAPETSLPEWSSIHLDGTPLRPEKPSPMQVAHSDADIAADPASLVHTQLYVPMQVAPLSHRVMAGAVDACVLSGAFLAAVCAFAAAVPTLPSLPVAAIASAATLLVLFILYHLLFFTFADATPGMRYARVGLCTFSDDNPTRAEMRRRIWHILLALCPLGLGLLWALLDEDGLGWHDRLSRMYQRSY